MRDVKVFILANSTVCEFMTCLLPVNTRKYGMEVYDKTPYVGGERGDDITAWFKRNPGDWQYAILDDDDDMGVHIDHLIRTDFDLGRTEKEADRCIELLQKED